MNEICLRGEAIDRFRFLLEHGLQFEKAAQLANEPSIAQTKLKLMLTELEARHNAQRLAAVQDESTLYSKLYRKAFLECFDQSKTVYEAANKAERMADTITAFTDAGNIARSGNNGNRNLEPEPGEIYLAITFEDYPATPIDERNYDRIRKQLRRTRIYFQSRRAEHSLKPHIVEFIWMENLGYVRVVCGDSTIQGPSFQWLQQTLPSVRLGSTLQLRVVDEQQLQHATTCFYSVNFTAGAIGPDSDILARFQRENAAFETSKWKIVSRKLLDDQQTEQLVISLPKDPDSNLLRSGGNKLKFMSSWIKLKEKSLDRIVSMNAEDSFGTGKGCTAYTTLLPREAGVSPLRVLNLLKSCNSVLSSSEWNVSRLQQCVENGRPMYRLTIIVDYSAKRKLKKIGREIKYQNETVTLELTKLKTALRVLQSRGSRQAKKSFRQKS